MLWLVFFVYSVFQYGTVPVTGQCTVSNCAASGSGSVENLQRSLEEHDRNVRSTFDKKMQTMQDQLSSRLELMINETLSSAIDQINEKLNDILGRVKENHQNVDNCPSTSPVVCDCSEIKANGFKTSGVYRIYVVDRKKYAATAYCDMTTENSSWTVFQRREDGSEDFYRGWSDYENGFGNPNGEFWLGNNFLHLLTSKKRYRLRVDLEDFEGGKRYAEYSTFNISSAVDKYRLRLGTYSGTAGDSLGYHNDMRFTTKDNDNDAHASVNCASDRHGAWWYNDCANSNLNGRYFRGNYSAERLNGMHWHLWRGYRYSVKTTEMKISSF